MVISKKKQQEFQLKTKKFIGLYNQGKLLEAASLGELLTSEYPNILVLYEILGAVHMGMENAEKALFSYYKVLQLNPKHVDAFNNIGMMLFNQGKFDEAIDSYKNAIKFEPKFADAHYNIGNTFKKMGNLKKAVESYKRAISIEPDDAEFLLNYGNALKDLGELDLAMNLYSKALRIQPDYTIALNNMGNILQDKGEINSAIKCYRDAISKSPNYAAAHNNLGCALQAKGHFEAAIFSHKKALQIKPRYAKAHNNLGTALQSIGNIDASIDSYRQAIKIDPDYQAPFIQKIHQQAQLCDWVEIEKDRRLIPALGLSDQCMEPFYFLTLEDAPERHLKRTENFTQKTHKEKPLPIPFYSNLASKGLRLGYFSTDFRQHPVSYLLARVIETHNRSFFTVYGYSLGPAKDDEMRRRLTKGFDVFKDVNGMCDQTVALLAQKDKIDIAIDLTGYTQNGRPGIFAHRAAPIQINYLGYPGTMGADFFDYIIADKNLIPIESQKYYSEKPIYLPHHFQAQDDTLPIADITLSRKKLGLPKDGFVFCSINNAYKITPSEFKIWMRLLKKIDGSVLWLLESNQRVKENLRKEAMKRGINSDRLVFAHRVAHEQYLSQFRQADLYLDTFVYNAGATASNALWAGLPVLTKLGKGYSARMAGSLLASMGLPELITTNETAYEKKALELATNSDQLEAIKQKLDKNRLGKPLFNTKLFTKHLENGYQQAQQQYQNGKNPRAIFVEP